MLFQKYMRRWWFWVIFLFGDYFGGGGVEWVWFGFAFVSCSCCVGFVLGFLFVACVADGLEVGWVVGASVGEVGDVVYFGCCGGAAGVVELAGVVVSV